MAEDWTKPAGDATDDFMKVLNDQALKDMGQDNGKWMAERFVVVATWRNMEDGSTMSGRFFPRDQEEWISRGLLHHGLEGNWGHICDEECTDGD